jgi:hypothetical protein
MVAFDKFLYQSYVDLVNLLLYISQALCVFVKVHVLQYVIQCQVNSAPKLFRYV